MVASYLEAVFTILFRSCCLGVMVRFLWNLNLFFRLNVLTVSLRSEENILGTHPFSFRDDSVTTTGLKFGVQSWL